MDGASSAATILQLIQVATQVSAALGQYVVSVKNAQSSCDKLIKHISIIISAAKSAKEILDTSQSSQSLGCDTLLAEWFADNGSPAQCMKEFDGLLGLLTTNSNGGMKWSTKLMWPLKERRIKAVISTFDQHSAYFQLFLSVVNSKSMKQLGETQEQVRDMVQGIAANASETRDDLKGLANGVQFVKASQDEVKAIATGLVHELELTKSEQLNATQTEQLQAVLRWFNAFDCTVKHEATLRQRQKQTCGWLFNVQQFLDWRSLLIEFVWLNGKPGAGKSVLAAAVIEELFKSLKSGETLAYFYCDFRNSRSSTAKEVVCSLVVQLLRNASGNWLSLFPELKERMDRGADPPAALDILSDLLIRASTLHERPMVVIDALDECSDLPDLLHTLIKLNDGRLRLFVTSRTELIIREKFASLPSLGLHDMSDAIQDDMSLRIKSELEATRILRILPVVVKDEILDLLLRKADGMFRWVHCQLDRLGHCRSAGDIRKVLDTLPIGLFETYERILTAIEEKEFDGAVASRALMWLVTALKPLTLFQLGEALIIELGRHTPNNDIALMRDVDILDICGSLVSFDEQSGYVSLSHFSVKEFLSSSPPITVGKPLNKYFVDPSVANRQLASLSIRCIIDNAHDATSCGSRRCRLVRYAVESGFLHIGHICEDDQSIIPLLLELQERVSMFPSNYVRIIPTRLSRINSMPAWRLTAIPDLALHIIIRFGPPWLLRQYLDQHPLKVIEPSNPLTYAAQFGDVYRATILLDKGLDVNKKGIFVCSYEPIACVLPLTAAAMACGNEHKDSLITLFLERGSNIPSDTLHAVLRNIDGAMDNISIVRRLMHHGADPNALESGDSALHASLSAYCFGHPNCNCTTIVPMLVDAGCKPEALNHDRISGLHLAAENGHVQAIRFLIDSGATLPGDIIHYAARAPTSSRRTVINLLLSAGADSNAVTPESGDSALHTLLQHRCLSSQYWACSEVAEILIAAGCKVDGANLSGQTPMDLAIVGRHLPSLQVLMDTGAQLPADSIHSAACSQDPEMLRFILHCGADARFLTDHGDSALHVLFSRSCWGGTYCNCGELARILMEAGCSCEAVNDAGESPLHLAIRNHPDLSALHVFADFIGGAPSPLLDIIHALAIARVPYFKADRCKNTHYLQHNGGSHSLSPTCDTAIHVLLKLRRCVSLECGCAEILRILVEGGCPTQSLNHVRESPLLLAVQNDHSLPVVEFLVGNQALVSDEIIHAACRRGSPRAPIVKLLMQHGVDHNTSDRHGDTPLHTLLGETCFRECDCLQTALVLIAAGYNPMSLSDDGKSVVQIAAQKGHISTVQFLLDLSVEVTPDLIHTVAQWDHPETLATMQLLWQRGADSDSMLAPSSHNGDTLLHCLARSPRPRSHRTHDYLDTVRHLCQVGKLDPSLPNWHCETALHLAARKGNLELARYLLDLGCVLPADVLHSAVEKIDPWSPNSGQVVELLIVRGAPVDSRNHRGDTLLHSLIKNVRWANHTHTDLFHRIVALDICDINALDAFGKAPLHYAAKRGLSSYVQLLLDKGAQIPTDIMHSVVRSFQSSAISCVQMILQAGAPLDLVCSKNGNTLLHTFLIHNCSIPAITRYVIENQGCNIHSLNLRGESPIFLAFKHHNVMVAEYLVARGARVPPGIVHTVLRKYGNMSMNACERLISLILRHGGTIHSPSNEGGNALHSLFHGHSWDDGDHLGIAQFLILQGCDVNTQDFNGRTPLHHAARNSNFAVVRFLIHKGAQVPEDILHDALANGNKNSHTTVHLLLERGASITARTKCGDTVLHTVLRRSAQHSPTAYLYMARLLIDKGCELNVLNSFWESPLHLAAQLGYISIVRLLLDKGAKLYGGVIYSAVKSFQSASFEPILKMLTHGGLADQTFFFERERHGLLHELCQNASEAFHTECMHKIHVLLGCGLHVEKHINTEDNEGFTPLGIVLNNFEAPCPSLVSYLIDIGAKFSDVNYLHLDNLRWARELFWYPDAVRAYHVMLERQSIKPADVLDVQTALAYHFSLPLRVVDRILEAAGYWACSSVTYQNVEFTYRQRKLCLSLPWLSSDISEVKLRRLIISSKAQDGRPFPPLSRISVVIQRQGVNFKPVILHIFENNLPSEATSLMGTAVWDRYDPTTEDYGFSVDNLVHGDTLCFERDMDIDPDDAEIELQFQFLQIHMYYTVESY